MYCDYCNEILGQQNTFNSIYGDFNRIVYQTDNFVIFPCLGQLREGHLLVASKNHINAAGSLENKQLEELDCVIKEVCGFIEHEFGTTALIFEHGVLDDSGANGGCGISHMHLHILPVSDGELNGIKLLLKTDQAININDAEKFNDTTRFTEEGNTYIFWGNANKTGILDAQILTKKTNYFESQYMRKIVASVFGNHYWNWKDCTSPEPELLRTFEKAKSYFSSIHDY